MNIVFLAPHCRISGGVKVIFRLAQGLVDRGHSVTVLVRKYNPLQLQAWFSYDKVSIQQMDEYETIPQCDVVVNYGDGGSFLRIPPNAKHVLFLQNFGVHDLISEKIAILYPYHAIIVVSNWLAEICHSADTSNVFVVHPGVDQIFLEKHNEPVVGATANVGSLWHKEPWKNTVLFEAAMLLLRKKIAIKPVLLSATITSIPVWKENNLPYSIIVDPPQQTLPALYESCPVWVSPSMHEGFGLTTLEAMACGCAVVTVRNLGLDGFLQNKRNCYVVRDNKEAVANAVLELLTNRSIRAEIVKAGKALAGQFTWQKAIGAFHNALLDVVKK